MKREELKATEIYARYASEVHDDFGDVEIDQEYYRKEQADSVMDAMEAHIKELEAKFANELDTLYKTWEDKCKELEDKVEKLDFFWDGCGLAKRGFKNTIGVANYIADLEDRIKELEASQTKWISVDDRLPIKRDADDYGEVLASSEEYTRGFLCEWDNFGSFNITHWMSLPQPPKSED